MSEPTTPKILAGRLFCLSGGAYSDYSIRGFFVALQDIDFAPKLKEFLAAHPKQAEDYSFDDDAFIAFLIREGLLLAIDYDEVDLGAYASLPSWGTSSC